MTKKVIQFSKAFVPCVILSSVLIVFGIVGFFAKGINFGLDYKPGLIEEFRIAPNVLSITYNGVSNVAFNLLQDRADVVISGTGSENETKTILFQEAQTLSRLAEELNKIANVKATIHSNENASLYDLFANATSSNKLSGTPYLLYAKGSTSTTVDDVRAALSSLEGISVQTLGSEEKSSFQVRMLDNGDESAKLQESILQKLEEKFGKNNVAIVRTDFIGSSFSKSIAFQSIIVLIGSILLIFLYSAFRFHWDFALGAVLALIHDVLIILSFLVWTQLEFSTMIVAAILTIVGYSINATIVILDRERSLLPIMNAKKFTDIINQALSDTLTRSVITTLTTLFAAVALYVFTSGDIKNFSLALIVGLISGCYSSIFISSAFIVATRKNWKPEYGIHHSLKTQTGVFNAGVTV